MANHRKSESGIVLIITLWIIVVLSTLALAYVRQVNLEIKMIGFQRDTAIVDSLANAGLQQALILLREDKIKDMGENVKETFMRFDENDTYQYDGGNEAWAHGQIGNRNLYVDVPFYEQDRRVGYYYVQVEDETSKFPINNPATNLDMIAHLLETTGVDQDDARSLAGAIMDWRDPDEAVTDTGGRTQSGDLTDEYTFYNGQSGFGRGSRRQGLPKTFIKNGPLDSIDELLLIPGMRPEIVYGTVDPDAQQQRGRRRGRGGRNEYLGLKNFVSVFTQTINLNTVKPEVLEAILYPTQGDQAQTIAENWVQYRDGQDGETYTEDDQALRTADHSDMGDTSFTQVRSFPPDLFQKYRNFFTIYSDLFVVTSLAEYEGIEKGYRAVVQRSFSRWDQLPMFGYDTNKLEDLEQVHIMVRLFEPLYDARQRIERMS